MRRNACENKNPEDLEIESKRFAKKIRKHSVELPCHCAHSGNRQEAREQRLYLEGLAFRVTFLRVLGLMLGLLVFGHVFHRFCHVFLVLQQFLLDFRKGFLDGLLRGSSWPKTRENLAKIVPRPSKIEPWGLQNRAQRPPGRHF